VGCEGKGERKIFNPTYFPIKGDGGTKIFLADGALPGPYRSKISDPKSSRRVGEKCLKNFPLF